MNLNEEPSFRGTFREQKNDNSGWISDGRASRGKGWKKGTGSYGIIAIVFNFYFM